MSNSVFFRHCEKATVEPVDGVLEGLIPEWLEGTMIRNGAGMQEFGPDRYTHMFDGLAVLHRIRISGGKATYSNRPLESTAYKMNKAAQRIIVSQYGNKVTLEPCEALYSSLKTEFEEIERGIPVQDCSSVNVVHYGDQVYAMAESAQVIRVDPNTLLPIGPRTIISDYVAINTATAHPHVLPNGNVLNMGHHFSNQKGPHYAFFQIPPQYNSTETAYKHATKLCEIPVLNMATPSYFHSFGITQNKIILVESPFRLNLLKLVANDCSLLDGHFWQEGAKSRILVVSMETGELHPVVYEADDLFVFHHANAYEEDGHLVVDVAAYNNAKFIKESLTYDTIDKAAPTYPGLSLRRYVLPLQPQNGNKENLVTLKNTDAKAVVRKGATNIVDVVPQILYPEFFEFPKINYKLNGLKCRYIYGVGSSKNARLVSLPELDLLMKVDTQTGKILTWSEEGVLIAEPVFVANPAAERGVEDDGVLLVFLMYKDDHKKVTLLILDAQQYKEIGRVHFKAEGTVPGTFHAQWANDREKIQLY